MEEIIVEQALENGAEIIVEGSKAVKEVALAATPKANMKTVLIVTGVVAAGTVVLFAAAKIKRDRKAKMELKARLAAASESTTEEYTEEDVFEMEENIEEELEA